MAEFLIKAKANPSDELTEEQVSKLDDNVLPNQMHLPSHTYESRSQVGDIIAVRPDGWQWGKEERLPNFIVVKVPNMTMEEAAKHQEPLYEEILRPLDKGGDGLEIHRKLVRKRKYQFSKADVEQAKLDATHVIQLDKTIVVSKLTEKTGHPSEIPSPKPDVVN